MLLFVPGVKFTFAPLCHVGFNHVMEWGLSPWHRHTGPHQIGPEVQRFPQSPRKRAWALLQRACPIVAPALHIAAPRTPRLQVCQSEPLPWAILITKPNCTHITTLFTDVDGLRSWLTVNLPQKNAQLLFQQKGR